MIRNVAETVTVNKIALSSWVDFAERWSAIITKYIKAFLGFFSRRNRTFSSELPLLQFSDRVIVVTPSSLWFISYV